MIIVHLVVEGSDPYMIFIRIQMLG